MHRNRCQVNRRILIIDDNPAIHEDFRKILGPEITSASGIRAAEAALFGDPSAVDDKPEFHIDSALQGREGADLVRRAREERRPYAVAFVDARMPPGWDGIETAARIWDHDPRVQIVICTAYSDHSWQEIRRKLVHADRLVILKKPFDNIEVLQLADALTEKWRLAREDRRRLEELEEKIRERGRDSECARSIDALLDTTSRQHGVAKAQAEDARNDPASRRHLLEQTMPEALRSGEFTLQYQPLVDIASRRIVSLEALLRWHSAQLGEILPTEFIPVAEESGLIVPLGEFVLKAACQQVVQWQQQNVPVVPVAMNVSAVQFERRPMWDVVRDILRETHLQPQWLALELTESAVMKNAQRHAKALQGLRGDGVRIQMDDFGTGYSSLSYLKHLPIDTLKIDRSFIKQLDVNSTDEAIVSAILAMTRSLGLRAVAEGVETPAQLEVLGRHGCEVAQGFYFCRPLPADPCRDLLIDLAARTSFTDTLRLRVIRSPGERRIAADDDATTLTGTAR